jgi:hypothetical protein
MAETVGLLVTKSQKYSGESASDGDSVSPCHTEGGSRHIHRIELAEKITPNCERNVGEPIPRKSLCFRRWFHQGNLFLRSPSS